MSHVPEMPASVRRSAAAYFAAQGVAVTAWWLLLLFVPGSRAHFVARGAPEVVLLAFWLPDLALLAIGSFVVARSLFRGSEVAAVALWFVCGAMGYATLYCLALSLLTDSAWLCIALMLPACLLSFSCALAISPLGGQAFRHASPARAAWNVAKTAAQVVLMWGVALFLLPALIASVERRIGIGHFVFGFQAAFAAALFAVCSLLGLWSGFVMARDGAGTPLPLDAPRLLVMRGPYAFVRNPMALSGIGQALAVALHRGSAFVLVYVLIGAWIWQALVRPLEEDDMRRHFGSAYDEYRRHVRCWLPRSTPYGR